MTSQRNRRRATRPIGRDRKISVRSARRAKPDLNKIAQAVVALAMAQAEADAQAEAARRDPAGSSSSAPTNQESPQ